MKASPVELAWVCGSRARVVRNSVDCLRVSAPLERVRVFPYLIAFSVATAANASVPIATYAGLVLYGIATAGQAGGVLNIVLIPALSLIFGAVLGILSAPFASEIHERNRSCRSKLTVPVRIAFGVLVIPAGVACLWTVRWIFDSPSLFHLGGALGVAGGVAFMFWVSCTAYWAGLVISDRGQE